jgi:hypothetical protein
MPVIRHPNDRNHNERNMLVNNNNNTVELHLSGLNVTASYPDMQNVRITGFYLEIVYVGRLMWKIISKNGCFGLHIYLLTNKTLIHNYLYVFDNWGIIVSHKRCNIITVRKFLT